MLGLKYQENVKVVLVTVALALILLAEPALAKKARTGGGKSARGGQKSQRVVKSSSASKVQRSQNVSRGGTKSSAPSRVSRSRIGSTRSNAAGATSSRSTVRPSTGQRGGTVSRRQPVASSSRSFGGVTQGRTNQRNPVAYGSRKSSGRVVRVRRSVVVSPSVGEQRTAGASGGVSSGKTLHIGALDTGKGSSFTTVGGGSEKNKPTVSTSGTGKSNTRKVVRNSTSILKQPSERGKANRKSIGETIKVGKRVPALTAEKQSSDSILHSSTTTKVRRNSGEAGAKSKSIVKQSEGGSKTSRKFIGQTIKAGKKEASSNAGKGASSRKQATGTAKKAKRSSGKVARQSKSIVEKAAKKGKAGQKSIGRTIKASKGESAIATERRAGNRESGGGAARVVESDRSSVAERSGTTAKRPTKRARAGRENYRTRRESRLRSGSRTSFSRPSLFTRPANERSQHIRPAGEKSQHVRTESREALARSRPTISRAREVIARHRKRYRGETELSSLRYRERSDMVRHIRSHEHVYIDRYDCMRRTIVRPRYRFAIYYNWGPWFTFRYFYPYYHRRYVFVSLGGYWPYGYTYMRYYWYGCHPYTWYGYYPIAREVGGDTYNYYTYNYYGDGAAYDSGQVTDYGETVDHTTFADVRERLEQQAVEGPDEETLADRYFEDAIKAFEAGDYDTAAALFAKAMGLAPDDEVLPFAYCQALFAGEKYTEAAEVLRAALARVSPEKEGVFYPRGLYTEDEVLFEQIDRLAEKAGLYSFDGDLQLLLGYHLLGIGEIDEAVEPLRLANQDLENASSAAVLLSLAEKIRIQSVDNANE